MLNNELQNIWKRVDSEIKYKSMDELDKLLSSKARKTVNEYLFYIGINIIGCLLIITWLIISSLNRQDDLLYVINNVTLGIVVFIYLYNYWRSWNKLKKEKYDQPLKSWLKTRINLLNKWLIIRRYGKFGSFWVIILHTLMILSTYVYVQNMSFIEALTTDYSLIGLVAAFITAFILAVILMKKIRDKLLKNLNHLKDLHNQLSNE